MVSAHGCPLVTPGMRSAGGMSVYLRNLAPLLAASGVCVDVFTRSHHAGGPEVIDLAPRARVIHIPAGPFDATKQDILPYLPDLLQGVSRFKAEEGLGYDLVHSHYWLSGWVGRQLALAWEVPNVVTFHTRALVKEMACGDEEPPERKAAEYEMAVRADAILAFTEDEAPSLHDTYGVSPERVRVARGGVDLKLFKPMDRQAARHRLGIAQDANVVLYVGRIEPFKGPDILVRALAEMRSTSRVQLILVGGEPGDAGNEWLRQVAEDAGVESHIRWQPATIQTGLPDYYAAADLCAMPSRHESFGLVALEAMACGTPVVASAAGALRSLILDGTTGCLVSGQTPAAFARCIEELLSASRGRAEMGAAAREWAERFHWDRAVEEVRAGYDAALLSFAQRPPVAPCAG